MKKTVKLGIFALASLLITNIANADQLVLMSVYKDRVDVIYSPHMKFEDMDTLVLFGIKAPPPENVTALISEIGKTPRWSTTPLRKLYSQLGGTGNFPQELFPEGSYKDNIKISKGSTQIELPDAKNNEIDLGLSGSVLPRSGLWNTQLQNTNATGCPAMISNVLAVQSKAVRTRNFSFSKPFHPAQFKLNGKPLTWKQRDPNRWRSTLADYGPNGAVKARGMSFKVVWDVNVFSSTHILMKSKIDVKLSPFLSAAFNGSQHCSVTISGDYKYIGD